MDKVVVVWSQIKNINAWKEFKQKMTEYLVSFTGLDTVEEDVSFVSTADGIEMIDPEKLSLIISDEEVDGLKIGVGRIKRWRNQNPNMRIIIMVDKAKYGSGKLHGLYEMAYYDALLSKDFKWSKIEELLKHSRTMEEAYEYYGLINYRVPEKKAPKPSLADIEEKAEEVKTEEKPVEDAVKPSKKDEKTGKAKEKKPLVIKTTPKVKAEEAESEKAVEKPSEKKAKSRKAEEKEDTKKTDTSKAEQAKEAPKKESLEVTERGAEEKKEKKTKKKAEKTAEIKEKNTAPAPEKVAEESPKGVQKGNEASTYEDVYSGDIEEDKEAAGLIDKEPVKGISATENEVSYYGAEDDVLYDDDRQENVFDASDLLIPVMAKEELGDKDWLMAEPDDIRQFVEGMEQKAFNPIKFDIVLSPMEEVLEDILDYFTKEQPLYMQNLENGTLRREAFENILMDKIEAYDVLSQEEKSYVFEDFCNFMWDYDILIPFIDDPTISDISLVAYDNIQIKRLGERYFSKVTFRTPNHYKAFINHIIKLNHVDLSDEKPDKTFMDKSTSDAARMRFVYSQEYINSNSEPSLVIRKVSTKKYSIDELVNAGMMTMNTAAYILNKVRQGASIIFTGTMASGKTTLMNTFIDFIRHDKRGLVIQENDELFSNSHPLFMFQTIRMSVDGKEMYDLRYLATFGLLMDLDYFIVGETKGKEAEQFVEAVYTNTTCWESIHAISARDALQRHASLATSDKFTYKEQLRKLAQGIDIVVYVDHFVIEQITEIVGWDDKEEAVIYKDVPITIPKKMK